MPRQLLLGLALCCLMPSALADYPPAVDDYGNDFAGVVDPADAAYLGQRLREVEAETGVEVVVVTIDNFGDYRSGAGSWEAFATGLFNAWGIGNLPANDGVLLLLSTGDRKVRIELGRGYADAYDQRVQLAIDAMLPRFTAGDYSAGLRTGVEQILAIVTRDHFWSDLNWPLIVGGFVLLSVCVAFYAKANNKMGWPWMVFGIVGLVVILVVPLLWNYFIGPSFGIGSDGHGGGGSGGGGGGGDF